MFVKKPKFWDTKKSSFISILLIPFTLIYEFNNLLNLIFIKKKFNIKTICIGNIYIGGTGKTPLAVEIFKIIKSFKLQPVFIKKFYKNQKDERKLLSKIGPIISMRSREECIKKAEFSKFSTAIIDDGLQEKFIDYDLKIVCFNKDNFIGNGKLIPAGPLRERLRALKNYDIVFFNGIKRLSPYLKKIVKQKNKNIKIFETSIKIEKKKINKKKNYLIFSGIGNPELFKKLLLKNNFKISEDIQFPDHYEYTKKDINLIKNKARILNAKILTTEKDYLRIDKRYKKNIDFIKINFKIHDYSHLKKILRNFHETN